VGLFLLRFIGICFVSRNDDEKVLGLTVIKSVASQHFEVVDV
jgi:hypothetical protein